MDDLAGPARLDSDEAAQTGDLDQAVSIKSLDSFLVCDPWGDIGGGAYGLFIDDTRVLSRLRLLLGGLRLSRLSSALSPDGAVFTVHGANHALPPVGGTAAPRGILHVERKRCLYQMRLYERVRLTNYALEEVMAPLSFDYAADFRDMFEVRGIRRAARGADHEAQANGRHVVFGYRGLDGVERRSVLAFSEPPWRMGPHKAEFMFTLAPGQTLRLYLEAGAEEGEPPSRERFNRALAGARGSVRESREKGARVRASDGAFQAWLDQSRADLAVLTTRLPTGPYPYAGIPWFSTPFGRDGIIAAWQMLWLEPSLAAGVLRYLAGRQARAASAFEDAAPGKIMHETRRGEMAALKEVPFGLYYGGVDTTPLFVALAGAYFERTGDKRLIDELWPSLLAAIGWMAEAGDSNGDGMIDYVRGTQSGLANQGWKDSIDSVFHDDGRFASGPIALVEVQGYAYAAWRAMAAMGRARACPDAVAWEARAEATRALVEDRFWMEDRGFYGLAIDGDGELCRALTSNPGHLLFLGLPSAPRAARATRRLLSNRFDSGWGLRTLAAGSIRYNPMSYHNGSIWPHDTGLAVAGMARYGERQGPAKILGDLFEAAKHFQMRMPELLCGFAREATEPPIAYPVACRPQAWAAGSTFMMLQACLGLSIDSAKREVRLVRPRLPDGVDHLAIDDLALGQARVALRLQRLGDSVAVTPGPSSDASISVVLEG
ncbi:MAG TPA: glycogen debranching N-terminal domain-containing protein [Caulobacteraceae bacterium]|nr:glycogen debranching N-terminal domain-containing protein [Caulobacteraceae bacterium]